MTILRALGAIALFACPLLAQAPAPASKTAITADLGIVSASGNTRLRTMNVGDKIVHTTGRWAFTQLAAYVYGETSDIASANQLRALLRSDYSLENRLTAF